MNTVIGSGGLGTLVRVSVIVAVFIGVVGRLGTSPPYTDRTTIVTAASGSSCRLVGGGVVPRLTTTVPITSPCGLGVAGVPVVALAPFDVVSVHVPGCNDNVVRPSAPVVPAALRVGVALQRHGHEHPGRTAARPSRFR